MALNMLINNFTIQECIHDYLLNELHNQINDSIFDIQILPNITFIP